MNMKKVLAVLLAMIMVFSFAACGGKSDGGKKDDTPAKDELLVEKKGVTIPAFEIKVGGVKITNEEMADYPIYEASVTSTNSSGTTSTVVYIGFKVNDAVKAAGLEGTAGKLTATADDGYAVEIENGASENNMIAISKDGTQFKSFPWFIPCDSETTGDQLKGCAKIEIEGMKAPAGADGSDPNAQQSAELAPPDKQDKTDKMKDSLPDFNLKIDGNPVTKADLEGLSIYKIAVQVLNKKGEVVDHTYAGFILSDVLDKLGISAGSIKIVANDGYESELGGAMVKNEFTMIAVECDKEAGEDGTVWIAPCSSNESNAYSKLVVEIKTK